MKLSDFDYNLPEELIAQEPVNPKDSSKLMVVSKDEILHKKFSDIVDFLKAGDVLVLNETKVTRSKITGTKPTGGPVELVLCQRLDDFTFKARIKARNVMIGSKYLFNDGLAAEVISQNHDIFTVRFNKKITKEIIDDCFKLPTPPYIKKNISDDSKYQTVFSSKEGSLAAPTAGLHFTQKLLEKIKAKGVAIAKICLHVDYGTFLPVRGKIEEHKMHREVYEVSKEAADLINNRNGRLVVVGTTSIRTLESCSDDNGKVISGQGSTEIFIYPGYKFKVKPDVLLTNFHMPKSTLLMLVSAYYGREKMIYLYNLAVKEKYRFFSFGDAMMLVA